MPRQRYDEQFKIEAAKLVREQGYTVKKAAQSLGVDFGSIRRWVREFGSAPSLPTSDATAEQLQRENTRLREENRRLLMEREILPLNASIPRPTFFAGFLGECGPHACPAPITGRDAADTLQGESPVDLSDRGYASTFATLGLGPFRGGGAWTASANSFTPAASRARPSPGDHS